jgi:NAD/NADP transhydrogenase beta subunit
VPTPDPNVPHWLIVFGSAILYVLAIAGVAIPTVVALWIKLVDMPHLRASNHAIVNSIAATYGQAQVNAKKIDAAGAKIEQVAQEGAPVHEANKGISGTA